MDLQKLLKEIFEYRDGLLIYKVKMGKMLPGKYAGCKGQRGYHLISFNGRLYRRHQLIYLYNAGYIPKCIGHIDGDCSNDRFENLKDCSQRENTRNRKIDKRNKSGYRGVCVRLDKFSSFILNNDHKRIYLGTFKTAKEASIAFEAAAKIIHGSEYSKRGICNINNLKHEKNGQKVRLNALNGETEQIA